jgi:hypothetical protein
MPPTDGPTASVLDAIDFLIAEATTIADVERIAGLEEIRAGVVTASLDTPK